MTDEQVQQLWENGNHEKLILELKGIAVSVAKKIHNRSLTNTDTDLGDVVSWALEYLWRAIQSWEPDTGVPLRSYAASRIKWGIFQEIKKIDRQAKHGDEYKQERVPIDILEDRGDDAVDDESVFSATAYNPEEDAINNIDLEAIIKRAGLTCRQQEVLELLGEDHSLREAGEILSISHEWVNQIAKQACQQLQQAAA